jgi:hypothetical protein
MNAFTFATGTAPAVVPFVVVAVVVVIPSLAKTSTYLDRIPPARGDPVPDACTGGACIAPNPGAEPPPAPSPTPPLTFPTAAGITGGAPTSRSAAARSLSGTLPSTHCFNFSS